MTEKEKRLKAFFEEHNKAAIGFSGGADSAFLLYSGVRSGADIKPYCIKAAFQPDFELRDAQRLCRELGLELCVIELDVLNSPAVASNPQDRCYYCKQTMFGALKKRALEDGYGAVIDGTNASDDQNDRPGMKAIAELEVLSPLRDCGITKSELREMSRKAGIFTWDKPAYACLATRIPTGEPITLQKLKNIENAENILFEMGFTDFRVRSIEGKAKLQFKTEQLERANGSFDEIAQRISPYFPQAYIDEKGR